MADNTYIERIELDNSQFVAGLESMLAKMQQARAEMQQMRAQVAAPLVAGVAAPPAAATAAKPMPITAAVPVTAAVPTVISASVASTAAASAAAMADAAAQRVVSTATAEATAARRAAIPAANAAAAAVRAETAAQRENAAATRDTTAAHAAAERRQLSLEQRKRIGMGIGGFALSGLAAAMQPQLADASTGARALNIGRMGLEGALSGGLMGGPWGAAIGGIMGLGTGAFSAMREEKAREKERAREMGELRATERVAAISLRDVESSREMDAVLKAMSARVDDIRIKFSEGVIPDQEKAKFRAMEASLQRQIALAGELKLALEAKETDRANRETGVEETMSKRHISKLDNTSAIDSTIEALSARAEEISLRFEAGLIQPADVAKMKEMEASLKRQIEYARQIRIGVEARQANELTQRDLTTLRGKLASGVEEAMRSGANAFTQMGFGTGTPVGAMMSGTESRLDRSNTLLQQIATIVAQPVKQPAGVFQ